MTDPAQGLPRSKGRRPQFLADKTHDDLLAMIMALTQELAVLRERCDTTERLLAAKHVVQPAEIEAYEPSPAVDAEREAWRRRYLDRVLFALKARAAETAAGETDKAYASIVAEIGRVEA